MGKLNITLAPPEPRDKSKYSIVDKLLDSIVQIKTPMIVDSKCIVCDLEYFGHDHNTDYLKCTVCGHIEEE